MNDENIFKYENPNVIQYKVIDFDDMLAPVSPTPTPTVTMTNTPTPTVAVPSPTPTQTPTVTPTKTPATEAYAAEIYYTHAGQCSQLVGTRYVHATEACDGIITGDTCIATNKYYDVDTFNTAINGCNGVAEGYYRAKLTSVNTVFTNNAVNFRFKTVGQRHSLSCLGSFVNC